MGVRTKKADHVQWQSRAAQLRAGAGRYGASSSLGFDI